MANIKLSKRLEAIARLIPPCGGVADVGTDHGYIPVWLRQNGYTDKIVASDINPEPLGSAIDAAIEHGLVDSIDFKLCDGLKGICDRGLHTVVIAGMGGETIADILSFALWTSQPDRTLVLQPMTKSDELRRWLINNNYKIISEKLVEDGRLYEILLVTGGVDAPLSPAELFIGRRKLIENDPLFKKRLDELIFKAEKAIAGMESSSRTEDEKRLLRYKKVLKEFLEMKSGGCHD